MALRLVVAGPDGQRDVTADVPPGTTLRDLLVAAGMTPDGTSAWVDGREVDLDVEVERAEVPRGATVSTRPMRPVVTPPHASSACPVASRGSFELTVVAGPGTGRCVRFGEAADVTVGRAGDNDLVLASATASAHHLRVRGHGDTVEVVDLASHNGTWRDGGALAPDEPVSMPLPVTLRLGAVVVRVDRATACEAPRGHDLGGHRRRVHRPPRPAPPAPVAPVTPPAPVDAPRAAPALRWAGILAPLALGAAMVVITGSIRFALFALLSPVMAVGTWWSGRRQERKAGRQASRSRRADLERFRDDLVRARARERVRREDALPDLATLVQRATEPSRRLWERRPTHDDAFLLRWGSGDVTWAPPVAGSGGRDGRGDGRPAAVAGDPATADPSTDGVAVEAVLHDLPVPLDLARHRVVGLVGSPHVRRGVARSLVLQAAVLHGPADLVVELVGEPDTWDWAKWLPHVRRPDRPLGPQATTNTARKARPSEGVAATGPTRLVVVDDQPEVAGLVPDVASPRGPTHGRDRDLPASLVLVTADHADQLPAACTVVVEAHDDGTGVFLRTPERAAETLTLAVATPRTARRCARALARCVDPEEAADASSLPATVPLADLVDDDGTRARSDAGLVVPIGRDRDGVVEVDLVGDGPHALVAGTTGSGKSELLRTLVTGLALRHTTEEVVFVLVDYKGGSAFRACADLPHTVGLVTDLDDALAERALRSLRAELRRRERVLAAAGVDDLPGHREAGSPGEPLPRLVVVIDEFATLATELPDFLDALVGIAQRGRSLGLHLVLATQRPRGCISPDIRANTDLRIALRVQGEAEARDVLDHSGPAHLDPALPGRAWLRRGQAHAREVQVAHASAPPSAEHRRLTVADFRLGRGLEVPSAGVDEDHLPTLVARCRADIAARDLAPPRLPWLPPLPGRITLDGLAADDGDDDGKDGVLLGLADLPDEQVQRPVHWHPDGGHLVVVGRRGSGTSTVLTTLAASLVRGTGPDDLHLQVVHDGTGGWKAARDLPHVGSVVDGHDHDDTTALLGWLVDEIDRRRRSADRDDVATVSPAPRLVVLVDGLVGMLDVDDPRASATLVGRLGRVLDDGPAVGVAVAAGTDRLGGIPTRLRSSFARRLVLDVDDRELAMLGVARDWSARGPGRALDTVDLVELQVAEPPSWDDLARRASSTTPPRRRPHRVTGLPDRSDVTGLPAPTGTGGLWLPVGTGRDAVPAALHLRPGDHAVVAGPARSGRTTVLQVISSQARRAAPELHQVAICDEGRSALHGWPSLDACGAPAGMEPVLDRIARDDADRWLVLVDDVQRWGDLDRLGGLLRSCPRLTVVASGRPDELRGPFGGWLRACCAARTGVLLQPDLAIGGELLDVRLPRHVSTPLGPGRGFVVDGGTPLMAQLARPPVDPSRGGLPSA